MRIQTLPLLLAGSLLLAACFENGEGVVIPDTNRATVVGRIDQTAPASAGPNPVAGADATTVAVVRVASDGSETTLARGDIDAEGRFSVDTVPTGESGLEVVAYTDAAAEVGRVLVHGTTEAGSDITVATIVPETTVESDVFVRLNSDGESGAAADDGSLALFVRMDDATGAQVAASGAEVGAVADAYLAARSWLDATATQVATELDAATRTELMAGLAMDYAESRYNGAELEAANDAFAEATLDGYLDAGASVGSLTLLTAARASGAVRGSSAATAATRLELVRHAVAMNLRARGRLAASVDAGPGESASAMTTILATARADVEAATTMEELRAALDAAADDGEAAVFDGIVTVTGTLDAAVEAALRAGLSSAFADADLGARLDATTSAAEAASVMAGYRDALDATVGTLLTLLPDGTTLDADAMVSLMMAARGGADLD